MPSIINEGREQLPVALHKYYSQRYSLFSLFDKGIEIDAEGWFSVTPEEIAKHIAMRMSSHSVVLDAFCGVGGNAIQFALCGMDVIAVEIDKARLECAKRNAEIYGVRDKIKFINADFFVIADTLKADAVFLSPPWGGPEYFRLKEYDLDDHMPFSGTHLFNISSNISLNICYFLPRNVGISKIEGLAQNNVCEIERIYLNDRQKCVCCYFGDLVESLI